MLNNKQRLIPSLANVISRDVSPHCSYVSRDHNKKIKIFLSKLK